MNKIAQLISVLSHPILMPTWMLIILFTTSDLLRNSLIAPLPCVILFFTITFLIPAVIILFLKKFKVIKSLTMEKREERFIPLFVMTIFLFIASRIASSNYLLAFYNFYLICNLILCVLLFWINMYWKISMHAIGWGSFSALLFILTMASSEIFLPYFIASIIISGIVGTCRLYLKSHNESQIYIGFIMGFALVLILFNLL